MCSFFVLLSVALRGSKVSAIQSCHCLSAVWWPFSGFLNYNFSCLLAICGCTISTRLSRTVPWLPPSLSSRAVLSEQPTVHRPDHPKHTPPTAATSQPFKCSLVMHGHVESSNDAKLPINRLRLHLDATGRGQLLHTPGLLVDSSHQILRSIPSCVLSALIIKQLLTVLGAVAVMMPGCDCRSTTA